MTKADLLQVVEELYIEGYSSREIAKLLPERCPKGTKLPADRTIRAWIQKHRAQWDLKRKQKEILKVEKSNEEHKALAEKIQIEVNKADASDYNDLDELQKRYKEIAMTEYKPRAVEIVIQCIKLKREIREGLKGDEDRKVVVELSTPQKTWDGWETDDG